MPTIASLLRALNADAFGIGADSKWSPAHLSSAELDRPFSSVVVDSRRAGPDSLFVALPGERADGHDFIAEALEAGAQAALVSRLPNVITNRKRVWLFLVTDTLAGLQALARSHRLAHDIPVVGVTGSLGKTTTKEIVAEVLGAAMPVLKSEANLNTEIGLPLELLRLRPVHGAAILEMGMYAPGDVALLADIARPQIGIVTNVAPIHLERLGSIKSIARAKSELVAALPSDGLAVLNGDDPWTRAMAVSSGTSRSVLVGRADDCDYQVTDLETLGLHGTLFTVRAEGRTTTLETRVPGAHVVPAFLAACAVGRELGLTWDVITDAVAGAALTVRQQFVSGPDGMLIIDDSYNAAPASVRAALELLDASPGQKIAVLGDMLELGLEEEAAHRQVGADAAKTAQWLVVCGPRSAWIAEEAETHGLPADRVRRTASSAEAVDAVRAIVRQATGDRWTVLVKGSRGMKLEDVVQGLRGEV